MFERVRGVLTYFSDGNLSLSECSIDEINLNEQYYFVLDTSLIFEDTFIQSIEVNLDFKNSIVKLCKMSNVSFIFINVHEYETFKYNLEIGDYLHKLGANPSSIHFINNNSLNTQYSSRYNFYKSHHLFVAFGGRFLEKEFKLKLNKSGKFFMNQNRSPKPHRLGMLSYLRNYNILDDVNYSFLNSLNDVDNMSNFIDSDDYKIIYKDINEINTTTKNTDNEMGYNEEMFSFQNNFTSADFENSYVNITSESSFYNTDIHLTEKTIKPFCFYQIPIIFGTHLHNYYLKNNYGFDLFEDIIDISFDSEPNSTKRLRMVVDEIKRIHKIKNEVITFYQNNIHRLESNRKIVENIIDSKLDLNTFKKIFL